MYKPERETEILSFWKEKKIFEKTLEQTKGGEPYVFYDGPPFATGLPHYGHILASTLKDAIPRYQTMKGRFVERKWGWDCHGLPIENIVEKDLGISGKKEIEKLGIGVFNARAREMVLNYVDEWKKTVERMGRWVDFDGSYKTMDNTYMESVWWALKEVHKKGLIYESTKVLPYCPRCETPIANSEIAMDNSYKDITDISVYVNFELVNEPGTFLLAWTTTPWTLPGNFALAVSTEIEYAKVKIKDKDGLFVLAKDRMEHVLKKEEYEIESMIKGSDLVGKSYTPPFAYFKEKNIPGIENAWKIYGADFVTTTDGTGIVHIAPGYGEEDMNLAKKENIPFIHHVSHEGKFKDEVTDFAGTPVKPKGDHQSGDVLIIKYLAHAGLLFAKEKIIHSYPHCFRCETPLYYFAIPAWFIQIQDLKPRLLELNEKIEWIPKHLKEGRFKKSMEGAPDWNISRNRFWASPLPFWKCLECQKLEVIGGIEDMKPKIIRNTYVGMRHGESEHNVQGVINSSIDVIYHLTPNGRTQAEAAAKSLPKVDVIYASPFVRTKETADIVKTVTGFEGEVIFDERLKEFGTGDYDGHMRSEYLAYLEEGVLSDLIDFQFPHGESYRGIRDRVSDFLYDIDQKYEGKNILVITHEGVVKMLQAVTLGGTKENLETIWAQGVVEPGTVKGFSFAALPHNEQNELDLHRPFIDQIVWKCDCGGVMKRIPEVIDCWFESGSMPFAQRHAPFENKEWFEKNFPAQFVAEYIAQTRTWFYYMHVISTMLFDRNPFEHVVTTGNVLAEDGQKMSKSKNNFPDPWILINKFGVDAIRYYLLASPLMKAEDLNFSEKGVEEIVKKHFNRLYNVISLYEMYKEEATDLNVESDNVLDVWIKTLLAKTAETITYHLERYEFDKATKPLGDFIEDLSVWYIRRSRDRFKGEDADDKKKALSTTHYMLVEFSKLLAPFLPFLAEDVYQRMMVTILQKKESVHLESWPEVAVQDGDLLALAQMSEVRSIVSLALEARSKTNIKVRQPLSRLMLRTDEKGIADNEALLALIMDEVNVKEVILDSEIKDDVMLDITLSPELIEEGAAREVMRFVQEMRKSAGLSPKDSIVLTIDTTEKGKAVIERFKQEIMKTARIADILFEEVKEGQTLKVDEVSIFNFQFIKI